MLPAVVRVLVPAPLKSALDYAPPADGTVPRVGQQVRVPLGARQITGVVCGFADAPERPDAPLKAIDEILDRPCLPEGALRFYHWAAQYTLQPPGVFLRLGLRGSDPAKRPRKPLPALPALAPPSRALNASQAAAVHAMAAPGFDVVLLDGVTGSGKTETYMEHAAAILAADRHAQILVLCPEIALTEATVARFAARFGTPPVVWHADIAEGARKQAWQAVADGTARLVVGARSALFLPFAHLRLIVVDEEHDPSYKQDEGVHYNARDLAVARARIEDCGCVLASATPALETLHNAQRGKYRHVRLSERTGAAILPQIDLIDMRQQGLGRDQWLSDPLKAAMAERVQRREQTLLFLNRRGYAPVTLCRTCGHRLTAPDSDLDLVYHKHSNRLVCHLTGFSMPMPRACPACKAEALTSIGPGVERLAEDVSTQFPEARLAIFSSDLAESPKASAALIAAMTVGEIDILVATQIAAKGHNFPQLTLVGVIDADLGLRGGDLRAGERTYQVLHQVAGRAGRFERPGHALIQTHQPDHPAMQALARQDRDAFMAAELDMRLAAALPPFGRLLAVVVSGISLPRVETMAAQLAATAPMATGFDLYGPAEPIHARVRGRWRRRLLLRADRDRDIQAYARAWQQALKPDRQVDVVFDVDPQNFY